MTSGGVYTGLSERVKRFSFSGGESNWGNIFAAVSGLGNTETAVFQANYDTASYITDGKVPFNAFGIITKLNASNFDIVMFLPGGSWYAFRVTADSSGITHRSYRSPDDSVAITVNGNTAPQAITSGQYVIWNGALYTATANIANGATLSASNLQATPNGGLNAIHNMLIDVKMQTDVSSKITNNHIAYVKIGRFVVVIVKFTTTAEITGSDTLFTLPAPRAEAVIPLAEASSGISDGIMYIRANGECRLFQGAPANKSFNGSGAYITAN